GVQVAALEEIGDVVDELLQRTGPAEVVPLEAPPELRARKARRDGLVADARAPPLDAASQACESIHGAFVQHGAAPGHRLDFVQGRRKWPWTESTSRSWTSCRMMLGRATRSWPRASGWRRRAVSSGCASWCGTACSRAITPRCRRRRWGSGSRRCRPSAWSGTGA